MIRSACSDDLAVQVQQSRVWVSAAGRLPGDSPENRIDVGNVGDPGGMDGDGQPGRAGDDAEQDERIQPMRDGQPRDKPQAGHPAPDRQEHAEAATAPRVRRGPASGAGRRAGRRRQ